MFIIPVATKGSYHPFNYFSPESLHVPYLCGVSSGRYVIESISSKNIGQLINSGDNIYIDFREALCLSGVNRSLFVAGRGISFAVEADGGTVGGICDVSKVRGLTAKLQELNGTGSLTLDLPYRLVLCAIPLDNLLYKVLLMIGNRAVIYERLRVEEHAEVYPYLEFSNKGRGVDYTDLRPCFYNHGGGQKELKFGNKDVKTRSFAFHSVTDYKEVQFFARSAV